VHDMCVSLAHRIGKQDIIIIRGNGFPVIAFLSPCFMLFIIMKLLYITKDI